MITSSTSQSNTFTTLNLYRLFMLRSIGIVGQVLVISVSIIWIKLPLSVLPLSVILITLATWNLWTWWRAQRKHPISDQEFFTQMVVDVLALAGVLYFTGGATNPFAWFFLLPLMITATVISKGFVWSMAGLTVSCYSLLMLYYIPLGSPQLSQGHDFKLHVYGMWLGFILSVVLIAYFVTKMASTLREHEQILAETREQTLRDERIIALGTLAAGAAHELGTPLGTMAIVAGELRLQHTSDKDKDLNEKLDIIQSQIKRCKQTLSVISASAGEIRTESGNPVSVETYLQQLALDWRVRRTAIKLQCHLQGQHPFPLIVADNVLSQTITNILDNAADASPSSVELIACWDTSELVIEINDRGPGLSEEASEFAGKKLFSTKKQGLGLGLFLAHASIERMGGSITLSNRNKGGVCTRITLPSSTLIIETKNDE